MRSPAVRGLAAAIAACTLLLVALLTVVQAREERLGNNVVRADPAAGLALAPDADRVPRPELLYNMVDLEKRDRQQRMYGRQETVSSSPSSSDSSASATSSSAYELPTAAVSIEGQPSPTTSGDPLLALMPDFAFSMPAQIVVDGINIALVSVLVIHLLFTVQYHFPLSRKNFYLQMSSSLMLLVSLSVTLHIILSRLEGDSQRYPFMFPYIGVQLPPGDDSWNVPEEVFYLLMRAITTALIHITHIQFLTLLFPSALEARLILWMLGPLAIINSGMEFTALADDADLKTTDLGDAIRNICNSTLTLLYTTALLIWGLLVNRRRAWRAGGGTASFGGGSVGLALINTAISFTEIKYDRLWWLPNVCWTLTIWQSWLGFWWWVSSGMGIGEVEDRQERLERKRKREERRRRKIEKQRQKLALVEGATTGSGGPNDGAAEAHSSQHDSSSIPGLSGFRRLKHRVVSETTGTNTLTRRLRRQMGADEANVDNGGDSMAAHSGSDHIELNQIRVSSFDERRARNNNDDDAEDEDDAVNASDRDEANDEPPLAGVSIHTGHPEDEAAGPNDDGRTTAETGSGSSDTNPTASSAPGWMSTAAQRFMDRQPNFIKARFRRLRLAHVAAARRAAHEQSALREQVLNSSRTSGPGLRHMMFDRSGSIRAGMEGSSDTAVPDSSTLGRSESIGTRTLDPGMSRSAASSSLRASQEQRSQSTDANMGSRRRRSNLQLVATLSSSEELGDNSDDDDEDRHRGAASARRGDRTASPSDTESLGRLARRADAALDRQTADDRGRRSAVVSPNPAATGNDDEWVDEPVHPASTAPARRGQASANPASASTNQVRRRSAGRNDDDASDSDGDEGQDSSWFWRGGLKQMRLRDRTTYD